MRNFLFVPGNNPKMLSCANFLGSDAIVLDLEDAVAPLEKDAARILVRNAIKALNYEVRWGVRINSLDTSYWEKDLEEILPLNPSFIMLPKAGSAEDIRKLVLKMLSIMGTKCQTTIIALVETAIGIENAFNIATADARVEALFLGAEDLTANLCAIRTKSSEEILYSRGRIVSAARAAGIDAYDTPFTDVNDEEMLKKDATLARQIGFTGKSAINPRQLEIINSVFTPSEAEVSYAQAVLDAIAEGERKGLGAVALKGKMIDAPVVTRAKYILKLVSGL